MNTQNPRISVDLNIGGLAHRPVVLQLKAVEGLNQCYELAMVIALTEPLSDLAGLIGRRSSVVWRHHDRRRRFNGLITLISELIRTSGRTLYLAHLGPRLTRLKHNQNQRVFLDQSVDQIIESVLKSAGLTGLDYELKLKESYPRQAMICQYRETDFDFVSRLAEHWGVYFYFEQSDSGEKVVFVDDRRAHHRPPDGGLLRYRGAEGPLGRRWFENLLSVRVRRARIPGRVGVGDYNYLRPSIRLEAETVLDDTADGQVRHWGQGFKTMEEGRLLARIRAEEQAGRQTVLAAAGLAPDVSAGYIVDLTEHPQTDLNRAYLVTAVEHRLHPAVSIGVDLDRVFEALAGAIDWVDRYRSRQYANTFSAMPADIQFRPPLITPVPQTSGLMHAKVDAAQNGQYPELDRHGRYKINLPYDLSDRGSGKASSWLRMVQPYGGGDHGFHFPLHKGAEVLLTFIDGNPSRPIIQGASPNPSHPSRVVDQNQTQSAMVTSGQNKMILEDRENQRGIQLSSPPGNTSIRLGAPQNGDADPSGLALKTDEHQVDQVGGNYQADVSGDQEVNVGSHLTGLYKKTVSTLNAGRARSTVMGDQKVTVKGKRNQYFLSPNSLSRTSPQRNEIYSTFRQSGGDAKTTSNTYTLKTDTKISLSLNKTSNVGHGTSQVSTSISLVLGAKASLTLAGASIYFVDISIRPWYTNAYGVSLNAYFIGALEFARNKLEVTGFKASFWVTENKNEVKAEAISGARLEGLGLGSGLRGNFKKLYGAVVGL
jgi:type VI secretion system secreted protein VgrG